MTESKLYFKFHRTTGFVRRPCFCRVVLLGALSCAKPAWGVRTRLLIRTWPGPAPVAPFLYIFTPKIQTWAQGGDEQLFNQPRPPVRASHGSGSFKQICRGVMQRNCWKVSPNSCGKIYPGFRSEDASLHLSMGISTAPFRDFFLPRRDIFITIRWGFSVKLPLNKEGVEPPCCCKYYKCSCLGFSLGKNIPGRAEEGAVSPFWWFSATQELENQFGNSFSVLFLWVSCGLQDQVIFLSNL